VCKSKIETEIEHLVGSNILVAVNYSEWVALIVPILKTCRCTFIYGDFKITKYPIFEEMEYTPPKIDHL